MISWGRAAALLFFFWIAGSAFAQPKLIDAHMHYNGDLAFLKLLLAKLDSVDALAFLLVDPKDLDGFKDVVKQHANRLVGLGEIQLDPPDLLPHIDRLHPAPFPPLRHPSAPN